MSHTTPLTCNLDLAARMKSIEPFHVMALLARAQELQGQGRDIVHMEIGEPDFASAAPIIEAGIAALRDGATHYTPATGIPALRLAIAWDAGWRQGTKQNRQFCGRSKAVAPARPGSV